MRNAEADGGARWRCAMLMAVAMAICDVDANIYARCAMATRDGDAAADGKVLALPRTGASSRAGHLKEILGANAQGKQGVAGATCAGVRGMGVRMRMRARRGTCDCCCCKCCDVLGSCYC
jgi:hypothetical protein